MLLWRIGVGCAEAKTFRYTAGSLSLLSDLREIGTGVNIFWVSYSRPVMNDTVAKLQVRLVPPCVKGGLGGISVCHDHAKSPPTPL